MPSLTSETTGQYSDHAAPGEPLLADVLQPFAKVPHESMLQLQRSGTAVRDVVDRHHHQVCIDQFIDAAPKDLLDISAPYARWLLPNARPRVLPLDEYPR